MKQTIYLGQIPNRRDGVNRHKVYLTIDTEQNYRKRGEEYLSIVGEIKNGNGKGWCECGQILCERNISALLISEKKKNVLRELQAIYDANWLKYIRCIKCGDLQRIKRIFIEFEKMK